MIYDFDERLEFSQCKCEERDMNILKLAIRDCVDVRKTDIETDKNGVDYIATLNGGAEIGIDVKTRDKGASSFWKHGEAELALEIWSVCPDSVNNKAGKWGWTLSNKTNVDFILFTFDATDWDKFYLLPYQLLRMAFFRNGREWVNKYFHARQISNNWQSEAVFVPVSVVIEAIKAEMQGEIKGSEKI